MLIVFIKTIVFKNDRYSFTKISKRVGSFFSKNKSTFLKTFQKLIAKRLNISNKIKLSEDPFFLVSISVLLNKMGTSEDAKECELKHRIIPKLTSGKEESNGSKKACKCTGDESKVETAEERKLRYENTRISFSDYFLRCIDFDEIKLFLGLLFAIIFTVGGLTIIYLCFIFVFKPSMWQVYFPTNMDRINSGEL